MTSSDIYKLIRGSGAKIKTDSRTVEGGDVFFSLKGDNFNGNIFARDALERGALKAVIDEVEYNTRDTILVDDALEMLQDIARIHRETLNIPVLAITGTNGKTTTKELVARVLENKFNVHYTQGNLNNHIGVPLTLLEAESGASFMVVEMGANHAGEIAALCSIARPDAGLITNIAKAHLEGFGSLEGVIRSKSELYKYLAENSGTVIYNDSNPMLEAIVKDLDVTSIPYGKPLDLLQVDKIEGHPELTIYFTYSGAKYILNSKLAGIHNAENIIAAISVGLIYGVSLEAIIKSISSYKPDNNRSQLSKTDDNLLLCDAYNANPESLALALSSFLDADHNPKTVIIGDMLELGEYSSEEHKRVVDILLGIDKLNVYLVGSIFCEVAAESGFKIFQNTDLLIDNLKRNPIKGNFVFIKGSRGIGLESIYNYL